MIKLEGKGPVKEMELFLDVLCSFDLVKTYSQSYVNIKGDRSLICADVGTPKWLYDGELKPTANEDERFITEDQLPDKYLPENLLYRRRKAAESGAETDA